jgi:transcriptional regulator with XRE-family HTH domain
MVSSAHAGVQPAGTRQAIEVVDAGCFGRLLRHFRLRAGLTQEALAKRAGLSGRTISDLERGVKQAPRFDTVDLLANALQLSGAERDAFVAAARPERAPLNAVQDSEGSVPGPTLPAPLTPLIGRECEEAAVSESDCDHAGRSDCDHAQRQRRRSQPSARIAPSTPGVTPLLRAGTHRLSRSWLRTLWVKILAVLGVVARLSRSWLRTLWVKILAVLGVVALLAIAMFITSSLVADTTTLGALVFGEMIVSMVLCTIMAINTH